MAESAHSMDAICGRDRIGKFFGSSPSPIYNGQASGSFSSSGEGGGQPDNSADRGPVVVRCIALHQPAIVF